MDSLRRPIGGAFRDIVGVDVACVDLTGRGVVRVRGGDRVRFLDGMLTAHVAALAAGECGNALLLERKGHLIADLDVIVLEDELLLLTAPGTGASVAETLGRYVIADDVELQDLCDAWGALSVEGPGAPALLERAGAPRPAPDRVGAEGDLLWLGGGWLTPEGFRALGPREALAARLATLAARALEPAEIERLRAEAFVPAFGQDFGERNFPQEARLEPAISFTKGCYIGQEIVARIHSRGAVNRLLVQLGTEGDILPGAEIRAQGKKIGEVTTVGASRALGYVRKVDAEPGTPLEIAGTPATVLYPPLS